MLKKSTILLVVLFSFFYISSSVLAAENELIEKKIKEVEKEAPEAIKEDSPDNEGKEEYEGDQQDAASNKNVQLLKYQIGDHGEHVIPLKRDLISLGYGSFSEHPSQHYDSETEDAVKKFQVDYELNETGIVDKDTLEKIEEVLSMSNQVSGIEDSDAMEEDEVESDSEEADSSEDDPDALEEGELDEEKDSKTSEEAESDNEKPETSEDFGSNKIEDPESDEEAELDTSQGLESPVKEDKRQSFTLSSSKSTLLKKGVRDPKVIELKNNLDKLGYGGITVTNYYGSFTEKRVKQFQKYYGLKVTGEADQATLSKIASLLPNPLSKGKRHKDTIPLKKDLNKLGYGGITVTNYYGSFTKKRVKQFQKYYDLKVTGEADQATLSKIASLLPNPLSKGKRHKDTIAFKRNLNNIGFGGITVTNYYGSFTEKRVKQFQKHYGLKVTGKGDEATLSEVNKIVSSPMQFGKRHPETVDLKKRLNSIGYGGITVTNYFGKFTEKRLKEFQADNGLPVSGIADEVTLRAISNQDVVKIFIDPGHGGQDPGASGHGLKEKNVVLEIALRVADVLTKNYLGVDVQLSRTADTFIELEERASQANAWGADYFVSIHNNAFNGSAHGFESYIYNDNVSQTTKDKQKDVHQYISSSLNVNDRGMKDANFSVLRNTSMPAILLELLFIDNKAEANKLGSTQFKNKLGNIVANAIAKSYSLKKR